MSELIVVSNHGPATFYEDGDGVVRAKHAAGGLAPSLLSALRSTKATWVSPATSQLERRAARTETPELDGSFELRLVDIEPAVVDAAVRVIANATLWFCHHNLFDRAYRPIFSRIEHQAWDRYRAYNEAVALVVAEIADENATVFVNDYHLSLVGSALCRQRPDLRTVHFSHTPYCNAEELRALPTAIANELIHSMCAFGACGFHTTRWAEHFLSCVRSVGAHAPEVFVSPLGVDADDLVAVANSPSCQQRGAELKLELGDRKLILRSDRLELSKNVLRGFLGFEELLETNPQWVERAVFFAHAYPSRADLPEYLAYRSSVEHVVERINERFGTSSYRPINLIIEDDYEASVAAQSLYDVLLVNPLRDGMNLVAKEGPIVNDRDGVLVLSKEVGAFYELADAALAVDPLDVSATAHALHEALSMSPSDRHERAGALKALASAHPPAQWFAEVIGHACRPVRD